MPAGIGGPWAVIRATLERRCWQSRQNRAGEFLNARVDCFIVVEFRIESNLIFLVGLYLALSVRLK